MSEQANRPSQSTSPHNVPCVRQPGRTRPPSAFATQRPSPAFAVQSYARSSFAAATSSPDKLCLRICSAASSSHERVGSPGQRNHGPRQPWPRIILRPPLIIRTAHLPPSPRTPLIIRNLAPAIVYHRPRIIVRAHRCYHLTAHRRRELIE